MTKRLRSALIVIAAALALCGCSTPKRAVDNQAGAEFKTHIAAPSGFARVYILPTQSKSLYNDLDGRAGIGIFPDGSEKGAPLAWTAKNIFVAFDITPGSYDLMAYTNDAATKFTKSMTFVDGSVYFLRPTFYRSAKDLNGGAPAAGLAFDPVPAGVGAAEIQGMDMAALRAEGQSFLAQARTRFAPVAPPTVAPPPSIEQKLKDLRALYQEGLITQQEYDLKRRALLDAY